MKTVCACDLKAHPMNPRIHGEEQSAVMGSLLSEIGYASAIVAYESKKHGGLTIIDGHLRKEILGDAKIDVLVVDLSDKEADLLLASHDKVGDLASRDNDIMSELIKSLDISKDLSILFSDMSPESIIEDMENVADDEKPVYPLAPNIDEGYDYAVILCRRQTEFSQLATLLDLPQREYKSGRVGMCRVLDFSEFLERWKLKK